MAELMTRVNINEFLLNYVGIDENTVSLMPGYVKKELIEDDYETFLEYFSEEV